MRKLKFHEQKLLKKVDFINWSLDNNVHQSKILRKYCIKKREHVALYNKLAAQIWDITKKIRDLKDNNPNKTVLARKLLGKLYDMGVIPTADTLERCDKITASSFCRRRLAVMMVKQQMVQTIEQASNLIEQGHVRVGVELVTDPAFLVTRPLSDLITWTNASKIRQHVLNYNNERDDFEA
uniref:U3 small nucleolar ribonucleoprotein protein IMP3 n=1 Tax=Acrobeloides nanus TaxID=290746 RepID=A0A914EFW2_9BILA